MGDDDRSIRETGDADGLGAGSAGPAGGEREGGECLRTTASSLAHDLNNFLTSMYLNVHIALRHAEATPEVREILRDMHEALPQARALTQQLLRLTRQTPTARRGTPIADLIRSTAAFSLRGSTVEVDFRVQDGLWDVDLDPCQVGQVVTNLVVNADHAMPGGGTLCIRAENLTLGGESATIGGRPLKRGPYVVVRFQDQGHGIPPGAVDHVFEPGFTTRLEGSGVGLATCRSLLGAKGGDILVESSGPRGTCIVVYLPALAPTGGPRAEGAAPIPRVLLVDEDVNLCRGVAKTLERRGVDVENVDGELEAGERVKQARVAGKPFQAVIIDVTDRGREAIGRTLTRLRSGDPGLVALAARGRDDDEAEGVASLPGFAGAVGKPYDTDEIWEALVQASVLPGTGAPRPR